MKYPYPSMPSKLALSVMLALGATSWNVWADTEDAALPEVKAQAAPIYPGSGDDVVRTGSKTDTPLRDIPASVAVVSADLLQEQGVTTMNDAMRNVSGVQPLMGGGYGFANNYTSRGLSLSFFRDDMPDGTAQNGYWRTMYDIERIEVLKGPGSALLGSAGPGGSINIITKKPSKIFNAQVGTTLGSFDTRNGYVDVTGAINDSAEARLIADIEHTDGYRGLERDIKEISPTVALHIAENKILTIDFDHREIEVKPDNYGILFNIAGQLPAVSPDTRYYSPFNFTDQTINRLGITHDWTISNALSMRSALVYEAREIDLIRNAGGNATSALVIGGAGGVRTVRQQSDDAKYLTVQNEVTWKVTTGTIKHTVLAGVEYRNSDVDTVRVGYNLAPITNILNPVVPETSLAGLTPVAAQGFNRNITSDAVSFYAQEQMALSDQFKMRAGLRQDRTSYEDSGVQAGATRTISVDKNLNSGSLGFVYQPIPTLSFYTGYSKGSFVNLATESNAVPLQPETSKQIEIGTKATLFGGKLDVNVALFDTKRENYMITLPAALSPTPDGKDQSRGIELDFGLHPLPGWNILGNLVSMDSQNTSSNIIAASVFAPARVASGLRPAGVSENTFSLWNSYELQTGDARGLKFGVGATYKGDSYADTLNALKVPSYTVFDAAISYGRNNWQAALNIKNLADKVYYTNPTFAGALPGDPRSAYLTLRYDFK